MARAHHGGRRRSLAPLFEHVRPGRDVHDGCV